MSSPHSSTRFTIEESLAQACHLVARDDTVSAVYLVSPNRPTFLEIHSGLEMATKNHLDFTVQPDGALVVRAPQLDPPARNERYLPVPHFPTWNLGFPDLSEGTR